MQLALNLNYETRERIAGQPIEASYLHGRLPYTVQVIGGKYAGESLVYLIHFSWPLQHSRHYVGSTTDLERRLKEHRRKHPHYFWEGKHYRRYHTLIHALLQKYSPEYLQAHQFELLHQARRDHGVPILMAVNRACIEWQIVQVWQADRSFEFYLKRRKHASRFCPICQNIHNPF